MRGWFTAEHKAPEAERRRAEGDDETAGCVSDDELFACHPIPLDFSTIYILYMCVKVQLRHIFTDVYKNAEVNEVHYKI